MPLDADRSAAGSAAGDAATAGTATRWFAAHELRTPLQGIQGGVALLLEERGAGLSALQLEALGLIRAATADLEQCITHLGELAHLAASPAPIPERMALGALLNAAVPDPRLSMGPALAAAAALDVLVAPDLAMRALGRLFDLAGRRVAAQGLVCELAAVEPATLTLHLPVAPSPNGDGAVLWHLASAEMRGAGALLAAGESATSRVTLRRAPEMPISG